MRRHPALWVTPVKELHYFDVRDRALQVAGPLQPIRMLVGRHYQEKRWRKHAIAALREHWPSPNRRRLRWDVRYLFGVRGDDWYCSLFDLAPAKRLPGEVTPAYAALDDDGVDAVARLVPDAKIIYLLRNPIDRVWSHLAHRSYMRGGGIGAIDEFLASEDVAARTSYAATLDRWEARFDSGQIFVGFLDDIARYPRKTLARVYQHIGVGPRVPHKVERRRVYSRADKTIPTDIAVGIAKRYQHEVEAIARRVGGPALTWEAMTRRLIDDPPAMAHLAHPLDPDQLGVAAPQDLFSGPLQQMPREAGVFR